MRSPSSSSDLLPFVSSTNLSYMREKKKKKTLPSRSLFCSLFCSNQPPTFFPGTLPCPGALYFYPPPQASFFVAIVIVQWADLMICKTRWLSIRTQGMINSAMNFGLFFETLLAAWLCYCPPINVGLGTRNLRLVHWFPAMPFSVSQPADSPVDSPDEFFFFILSLPPCLPPSFPLLL